MNALFPEPQPMEPQAMPKRRGYSTTKRPTYVCVDSIPVRMDDIWPIPQFVAEKLSSPSKVEVQLTEEEEAWADLAIARATATLRERKLAALRERF